MRDKIRLVSSAGTGYCYYTRKNKRTTPDKLKFKKYDPIVRKHVEFVEAKMPSHRGKQERRRVLWQRFAKSPVSAQ